MRVALVQSTHPEHTAVFLGPQQAWVSRWANDKYSEKQFFQAVHNPDSLIRVWWSCVNT